MSVATVLSMLQYNNYNKKRKSLGSKKISGAVRFKAYEAAGINN